MRGALLRWGLRLAVQLRVILDAWERSMLNALLAVEDDPLQLQIRDGTGAGTWEEWEPKD